jgi:AcrR family transcriptional regulator
MIFSMQTPDDVGKGRRYAGRSLAERKADRRGRLLEAGLELFGRHGFRRTSIQELCLAAGITARHFYEEFESREAILQTVFDQVTEQTRGAVVAALESAPDDVEARLRAGLGAFVHTLLDDPRRARIQCIEVIGVSPQLERHGRRALHSYAELVKAEADRAAGLGLIAEGDFRLRSLALVAGVHELIVESALGTIDAAPDIIVNELVQFFLAAAYRPLSSA